jgi:hypothetical protein
MFKIYDYKTKEVYKKTQCKDRATKIANSLNAVSKGYKVDFGDGVTGIASKYMVASCSEEK